MDQLGWLQSNSWYCAGTLQSPLKVSPTGCCCHQHLEPLRLQLSEAMISSVVFYWLAEMPFHTLIVYPRPISVCSGGQSSTQKSLENNSLALEINKKCITFYSEHTSVLMGRKCKLWSQMFALGCWNCFFFFVTKELNSVFHLVKILFSYIFESY